MGTGKSDCETVGLSSAVVVIETLEKEVYGDIESSGVGSPVVRPTGVNDIEVIVLSSSPTSELAIIVDKLDTDGTTRLLSDVEGMCGGFTTTVEVLTIVSVSLLEMVPDDVKEKLGFSGKLDRDMFSEGVSLKGRVDMLLEYIISSLEVITDVSSVLDDVNAVDDNEYTGKELSINSPEVLVRIIELRNTVVVLDILRLETVYGFKVVGSFEGMARYVSDVEAGSATDGSPETPEGVDVE